MAAGRHVRNAGSGESALEVLYAYRSRVQKVVRAHILATEQASCVARAKVQKLVPLHVRAAAAIAGGRRCVRDEVLAGEENPARHVDRDTSRSGAGNDL